MATNSARNVTRLIPVASAITTKKVNALRLPLMGVAPTIAQFFTLTYYTQCY